ncbi:MAG TPA: hypothetical protein VMU92_13055 [Acidobacteriaceae bacterium]|nr:hypothetical protein [Acidobacteriaceae bacterium]
MPEGTPLPVVLGKHVPMRKGVLLSCKLLYAVYADNDLVIPKGSMVKGSVIALKPDKSQRWHARLWGDFTPFHIPVVHFDEVVLPDGEAERIVSDDAANGAPVLHLRTPVKVTAHSLIARQFEQLKAQARDTVRLVTAPGRGDRLEQFLYHQLPYHPERINDGTMWTVTLAKPVTFIATLAGPVPVAKPKPLVKPVEAKKHPIELLKRPEAQPEATTAKASKPTTGIVRKKPETMAGNVGQKPIQLDAYLEQTISSANEKAGNTFEAKIAKPVFNPDHTLAIPQGAMLVGMITEAKPAKIFGRSGKLRFDFRELKMPGKAISQRVLGTLAGADTNGAQDLRIDVEGGLESKPKNRIIVPLLLMYLAGRSMDQDGPQAANAGVASNGFGLVGRIVGMVASSRNVAAGIGFYAAGLSIVSRWIERGHNVTFVKNTRIEVTTTSRPNLLPVPSVPVSK